jgi:hypothetical protein
VVHKQLEFTPSQPTHPPLLPHDTRLTEIWIRRRFQTPQPIPNHKRRRTKPAKTAIHKTRPRQQRTHTIQTQPPDEARFVPPVPQDPICVAQGGEGVRAEISCLKAGGAGAGYAERFLEVLV